MRMRFWSSNGAVGLHAQQDVLRARLLRQRVVAVVGRHQRNAQRLVQLEQTRR